jgi:hypothetical protein
MSIGHGFDFEGLELGVYGKIMLLLQRIFALEPCQ